MDFIKVYTGKIAVKIEAGSTEVYIDFKVFNTKDLMTRGHSFYAVYNPKTKLWTKDEMAVVNLVDAEIMKKVNEVKSDKPISYGLMEDYQSGKLAEIYILH